MNIMQEEQKARQWAEVTPLSILTKVHFSTLELCADCVRTYHAKSSSVDGRERDTARYCLWKAVFHAMEAERLAEEIKSLSEATGDLVVPPLDSGFCRDEPNNKGSCPCDNAHRTEGAITDGSIPSSPAITPISAGCKAPAPRPVAPVSPFNDHENSPLVVSPAGADKRGGGDFPNAGCYDQVHVYPNGRWTP